MATVTDITDGAPEVATPEVPAQAAEAPSRAQSVLDAIRANAAAARKVLWVDVPLPDTVPGGLGLRLGIPTDARESALDESPSIDNCLADIATNIVGVVDLSDDSIIDGLDVITLAGAYAAELYGASRPVSSEVDAVRELYTRGSPPSLNAQAVRSIALRYRRWALDPTPPRSSGQAPSE